MSLSFLKPVPKGTFSVVVAVSMLVSLISFVSSAHAEESVSSDQHLITIHDRGVDRSIITKHRTLREAFKEANITTDPNDMIEPGLDEELTNSSYQVNVYRARPVNIVDGMHHVRVMSAYQTPKQIVSHAGMSLRDEDKTDMSLSVSDDMVTNGAGVELTIDRATAVNLTLYGKKDTVYTQATSVGDFLNEKKIVLAKKDTLSVKKTDAITEGISIEIYRNGEQTKTENKKIKFSTREIQDADKKVGYRKVKTKGVDGKKAVTYKVTIKNGKEVKRKEIRSVVIDEPKEEVVIVGAKPAFDGDFANALAKLRACEGGYESINPAGPYYGAYQFDRGTWNSVSSAPYGNASPAEQDAAARKLYERRGWSPWPVCAAGLPDTYR